MGYNKINPNLYLDEVSGESYPDYSKLVGIPIKLGCDKSTMELFDEITKQLINDGLVEISDYDEKTLISFKDESEGFPISRVIEDKGDGVMVTFNENGSLSPYEEKVISKNNDNPDYDTEYESEEMEEEIY